MVTRMLATNYVLHKPASSVSQNIGKLIVVLHIMFTATNAQLSGLLDASADTSIQLPDSAFCMPPDLPGHRAWTDTWVDTSNMTFEFHQLRPMVPLQAHVNQEQVRNTFCKTQSFQKKPPCLCKVLGSSLGC